jgi:hypothetical protein
MFLKHPSAIIHSVHFYDTDDALIRRLRAVVESALSSGSSAVLIMTADHRDRLVRELAKRGTDVRRYEREARLQIYGAEETLERFMVDGRPAPQRFLKIVGQIVQDAKEVAVDGRNSLTAFGEMVAVLWEQGNKEGALALEQLWNELLSEELFHLHCAYPRKLVAENGELPEEICAAHSHLIGGYAAA